MDLNKLWTFDLILKGDFLKVGTWLQGPNNTKYYSTPWYLKILGFQKQFEIQTIGEPIQLETGEWFSYRVQLKQKYLCWFKFKIYTYKNVQHLHKTN